MNLIFILCSLVVSIQCWHTQMKIENMRHSWAFNRQWWIFVKSNMGGIVTIQCYSNDKNHLKCERPNEIASSQGGYLIKDLRCDDISCNLDLETGGIKFTLEINCQSTFDMTSELKWNEQKYTECLTKRDFQLDYDGKVHYEDKPKE